MQKKPKQSNPTVEVFSHAEEANELHRRCVRLMAQSRSLTLSVAALALTMLLHNA
jgi:hypothetical protein